MSEDKRLSARLIADGVPVLDAMLQAGYPPRVAAGLAPVWVEALTKWGLLEAAPSAPEPEPRSTVEIETHGGDVVVVDAGPAAAVETVVVSETHEPDEDDDPEPEPVSPTPVRRGRQPGSKNRR